MNWNSLQIIFHFGHVFSGFCNKEKLQRWFKCKNTFIMLFLLKFMAFLRVSLCLLLKNLIFWIPPLICFKPVHLCIAKFHENVIKVISFPHSQAYLNLLEQKFNYFSFSFIYYIVTILFYYFIRFSCKVLNWIFFLWIFTFC